MNELVESLRARYGEREANAWAIHDVTKCDALLYEEDMAAAAARTPECDCGEPARVLAEVEAAMEDINDYLRARALRNKERTIALRAVLIRRAKIYASHPEFKEGWRV